MRNITIFLMGMLVVLVIKKYYELSNQLQLIETLLNKFEKRYQYFRL